MDGPPMLNQCSIMPGDTMIYNFTVPDQVGSYWYHSHSEGQYMDGMRGTFIIEDPDGYPYDYDEEVTLTVSEWYHELIDVLHPKFLNRYNPTGAEPIPQNLLFNDTMNDHDFEVVAVDGIYVEKNITDVLYITVAQRYDVLIHTKNDTSTNYAFMQKFDEDMLDVIPKDLELNRTNTIMYNEDAALPEQVYLDAYEFLDDFYLKPIEEIELLPEPDHVVTVTVAMDNLNDGKNYAFFNNITHVTPLVPVLGTVLSAGEDATNPAVYGSNTNTFVLQKDEIVEIVLNNNDPGKHPFHLHGHVFQIVERGDDYTEAPEPVPYTSNEDYVEPEFPSVRDVLYVRPNSYFRIRFKADNPGIWFFHCHLEWHLLQGLSMVFVEDPLAIQQNEKLTENWKQVCEASNQSYVGNAAGNTQNFLDLTGEAVQVKALPAGFTAKGIVALVFSCIAGVLGVISICIYGMSDIPNMEERVLEDFNMESKELLNDEEEEEIELQQQSSGSSNSKTRSSN
ncbi:unnamed protein product [Ambrosiozyma monospora]|uniref:Unnamed protein product n=1 Tax=Ambrosiozyma monospora TaxID=43982 RepID=A0A9W6YRQ5_AMBMO|nr:unnamed protein product [Ambrosiozyma monospora]